jgi:histone H3/H4
MESYIVTSKVKKYIKEKGDMNTSASFFAPLNEDIVKSLDSAIDHAKKVGRKTVMGKDFNLYLENPKLDEILVVASKIKKYVKEKEGLSTSSQAMEQLTVRLQKVCELAMNNAKSDKRKTVMDRDFQAPTHLQE